MVFNITYDSEKDILNMYKWKCGFSKDGSAPCPVKCMDKISLIAHLKMAHGVMATDARIPKEDQGILYAIKKASGLI